MLIEDILNVVINIQTWILSLWWFWTFAALFFLSRTLWLTYINEYYKRAMPYVLLELRIPREVRKSPRAMEQVFTSIHAIKNSPSNMKEKWWDGETPLSFSCEVTSFGGEVRFFMHVPKKHRNMVESALYAQYIDIEIAEVAEDYIKRFPTRHKDLVGAGYKLFGNELILAKPDAYPIRTYIDFEDNEEERQLDPISALLEVISKIKPQETFWVQIIVKPIPDDSWKEETQELITEFKESTGKTMFESAAGKISWTERSPGELERLKAMERCISKPGFDTLIRYLYIVPEKMYDQNFAQRSVFSAFNQYMSESLNKFKHNTKAWTRASFWYWPHLFPIRRQTARRDRIYRNYRARKIPYETFASKVLEMKAFHWGIGAQLQRMVLNTEELATIYHMPTAVVLTGPLIKRVEAKKTGPPAGLPIYGEGGEELPGLKKQL